ncbi:MAG: roadblock/LC7 domain-containing protein, partial [Candidatus Heimdallarchaeota archaeon]|nr:roadblock/LC7 domain-containing protein [Candidatus Heimdallarchaeota archaeon]MCK4876763.1 roadblock/LC7 domain-containing protein [Candidatus Heimdallarchaeota archaeon]
LHEIITSDANINHVILADKTGLTLAYSSRFAFDEFETEALGAIASAVYLASEQQGQNVGLAELDIIISEFQEGLILVASCGSTVLCLITDTGVALGMVRRTMKIAAEKVRNILDVEAKPVPPPEVQPIPAQQPVVVEEKKVQDEFISDLELALRELEQF